MPADTLLDIHELQRRLSCGRSAAYQLVATGVLRTVRVGRAVRVPESALAAFIEAGGLRTLSKGDCQSAPSRAEVKVLVKTTERGQ
jgi:excisionase family DNA binding protein